MKRAARDSLVDTFLAAALEPQLWLTALDRLADATGSLRGQLIGIGGARAVPFNWVTNLPERATDEFVSIAGGSDKVNYRVAADRLGDRRAIKYECHYEQACAGLETDIYLDFCHDYDLPFGCQATILHRDDMLVGLALLRSRRDGSTSVEHRRTFASMVPHVRAAVCMQLAMEDQGSALIAGALEAMDVPAFVLDGQHRVCAFTPSAEAALAASNRIRLIDRQLRGASAADDRAIAAAIASASSSGAGGHGSAAIRLDENGFDRALLTVLRLPTRPMNFGFMPHAIAILRTPGQSRSPNADLLRLGFGLSLAEATVAAALAAGRSRADIAAERQVSVETVRAQIKSLFVKMGVSREAELIAKMTQFGY